MLYTILFYGGIILVAVFSLALVMASKEQKKIARKTNRIFLGLDKKYENFVEKSLNLAVISQQKEDADLNILAEKVFTLLKPDIQGILSYVNSVNYSSIELTQNSKYFGGAISMTQSLFRKTGDSSEKTVNAEDEQKFQESFMDSIKADLSQRILDLKSGNYLD